MKPYHKPVYFLCCLLLAAWAGCSVKGGDSVKIVTKPEQAAAPRLKEADRAMLEELKKTSSGGNADAGLSSLIKDTARTMTMADYLSRYPAAAGAGAGEYAVGAYDVLGITVYDEPDLSSPALRIAADGYIAFPLIGRLKVDGLTTAQIEALITRKLAQAQILLDAHVAVMITECNSAWFLVLGAVANPGSYPLAANERVLNALSKAGGISQEQKGAGRKAKIVRTLNAKTPQEQQLIIHFDLQSVLQGTDRNANIFLANRDTLFISMPENFYILGEVKKPGAYPLAERDISIVEAIGIAGGFTNIAARNSTRIIRGGNGQEKIIEVKVDAITDSGMQLREIILQPNDIIIVPESFF